MASDGAGATPNDGAHPRAVIWDMDGVLLDSAEQHRLAWHRLAVDEGVPYSDADFWATFGMRNADVIPRLFGADRAGDVPALAARKEAYYRELLRASAATRAGARSAP